MSAAYTHQNLRNGLRKRLLRQERCARRDAWELTKSISKRKEKDKTTFFSPSDVWCLPAPSSINPEERDFCGLRGLNAHAEQEDLNSAELKTVKVSRNPTTGITANGEVQTNKEATVHVNDLDLFVTVQLLEDTPLVLSLGKLCEGHGCSYEWTGGQKPHMFKNVRKMFAVRKTTYLSLFRACPLNLQLQPRVCPPHRYLRTEIPKLRSMQKDQHYKGCTPVSVIRAEKIGDGSQGFQRGL